MSLFRKIRRRHKAFGMKRSAQIYGDKAASVFPLDDGEDGAEGDDADLKVESLQQADEQNGDILLSAGHETHQMPFCMEHFPVQTDDYDQPSTIIRADSRREVGQGMKIVGKENRFWFCIAKTAAFCLVTVGAFSVGKLAATGIVLTVALAFKLFGRHQIDSGESFTSTETEQGCGSHESLPSNTKMVGPDIEEMVTIGNEASLVDESNGTVGLPVSHLFSDTSGRSQETLQARDVEALDFNASGDALLAQRKKLTRLNCIKIPPSASPFVETLQDSPSSYSKASPRTWFCSVKNSTPTGTGSEASFAEMSNRGKFKSKVLLRHLRSKGETQSAPSSPLSSSQEGSTFWIASDGSDTERSAHPTAPVRRRSKFRPPSPAKEGNSSPDQQPSQTLAARKGERTSSPTASVARKAIASSVHNDAIRESEMGMFAFMSGGQASSMTEAQSPTLSQAVENMQAVILPTIPTSRDVTVNGDIDSPLTSTHAQPRQRREKIQSSRSPVTLLSHEGITAVQERREMRRKQARVGPLWVTAGLMIMLAGLSVGRMMAVIGLVCYWYSLSFKNRKAPERRR